MRISNVYPLFLNNLVTQEYVTHAPLAAACHVSCTQIVNLLLAAGAKIESMNENDTGNALHAVMSSSSPYPVHVFECLDLILNTAVAKGMNMNDYVNSQERGSRRTPSHFLHQNRYLQNHIARIVSKLTHYGLNNSIRDSNGLRPSDLL